MYNILGISNVVIIISNKKKYVTNKKKDVYMIYIININPLIFFIRFKCIKIRLK